LGTYRDRSKLEKVFNYELPTGGADEIGPATSMVQQGDFAGEELAPMPLAEVTEEDADMWG
jgi:hypothetical protein